MSALRKLAPAALACLLGLAAAAPASAAEQRASAPTLRAYVTGNGTIVGSGMNCGAQGTVCSLSYALGTTITLEAVPERFSVFAGWSGACSGTAPTCTLDAGNPTTVTASFSYIEVIDVNKEGEGQGTVTSMPDGLDCGTTCSVPFTGGTKVSLAAKPAPGSVFVGWGGVCKGTGACELQQSYGLMTVTARFEPKGKQGNYETPDSKKKPPGTRPTGKKAFLTKSLGAHVGKSAKGRVLTLKLSTTHAAVLTLEIWMIGRTTKKMVRSKPLKMNPGQVTLNLPMPSGYPAGTYAVYATITSIEEKRRPQTLKWVVKLPDV